MAEHIDVIRLRDDLRYRFEYLSKFVNFTCDDIEQLNKFALIVFPLVPSISEKVYRKLFSFDVTRDYFVPKMNRNPSIESAEIEFRRDMLNMYLKRVLSQREWNDNFLEYLSQVGKFHTSKAGLASIYVDYIHVNLLFGFIEHLLIEIAWNSDKLESRTKKLTIAAITKVFAIQNEFFSAHYLHNEKQTAHLSNDDSTCHCM